MKIQRLINRYLKKGIVARYSESFFSLYINNQYVMAFDDRLAYAGYKLQDEVADECWALYLS